MPVQFNGNGSQFQGNNTVPFSLPIGNVFTQFNPAEDVVTQQQRIITEGLWSNNLSSLTTYYTSSAETATQKQYYYEVWDGVSTTSGSLPQFSVTYGHRLGSGSLSVSNDSPSKAIYSQYKLLLLEPGDSVFTFANTSSDHIYVININRAQLKQTLDAGNWQLALAQLSGSNYNAVNTGSGVTVSSSNNVITLIDDSSTTSSTLGISGPRYNIVSGTLTAGVYNTSAPQYYGLVYPNLGILVLNADTLNMSSSFKTVTSSANTTTSNGDNAMKLFKSISGSAVINSTDYGFQARNEQMVTSTNYFVRAKNIEYNFSNNPSFVTGTLGDFAQSTFLNDPKVYITTVGLYNDKQELLAVAKLSRPLQKNFETETLVKVRLDF